jgi:lipase maturation factor 1
VNPYGLFAVMTMDRPEIVIEGSDDAVTWREYGFRYKPGDVHQPPRWSAPHMPRLDWQMWFAALGPAPTWFRHLIRRLLEGSPEVLALFETNPFPDRPPRYVRALLYDYHMTDRDTLRRTGTWWRRELLGTYFPIAALEIPAHTAGQQPGQRDA